MDTKKIYRALLSLLIILQLTWYFFPWEVAYSENSIGALAWLGVDGLIESKEVAICYSQAITGLYIFLYLGLFFYMRIARTLFSVLVVFGGLTIPFFGLGVESGFESMLNYYMTGGDGLILCFLFFSELKYKFERN